MTGPTPLWKRAEEELLPDGYLEVAVADATRLAGEVFGKDADTLETLAVAGWQARQMPYVLFDFVERARYEQGASWAEIGEALGISRQAARKRFDGLPPERLTGLRPARGSRAKRARQRSAS